MDAFLGIAIGCALGALAVAAWHRRRAEAARAGLAARAKERAKDDELRRRDQEIRRREEWEAEAARRREEWREQEERLARREAALERRDELLDAREHALDEKSRGLAEREEDVRVLQIEREAALRRAREDLERIAGLSREQAAVETMARLDDELREERAARVLRVQEALDDELERRAQKVLASALQRTAVRHAIETNTATVALADPDKKGRIVGRDGRNVRAFERATGVDVLMDDAPGVVVLSCFDPVRRETARRALEALLQDGRIHPGRIEEVVAACRRELEEDIRQTARKTLSELDVPRVDPRIQFCLGRLKYRTSYGQNQLEHAIEVAWLASALAGEMKLNPQLAKRCGLFHDLGKAVDHDLDGGHATLGAELARRCRERAEVVNAIAAHHGDVPAESPYAVVAQVADAVSAARPGARRDTVERHLQRLERLEAIAREAPGVDSAHAIQAGRELRILVDAAKLDDAAALLRAREIARRIERELQYPGEIKVTVIRETRVVEYAR